MTEDITNKEEDKKILDVKQDNEKDVDVIKELNSFREEFKDFKSEILDITSILSNIEEDSIGLEDLKDISEDIKEMANDEIEKWDKFLNQK